MIALLDVNVLVALAWPNHVHHNATRAWFDERRLSGWATCPLTESGFIRISCIPSVVHNTVTPTDAIALLTRLRQLESHSFWPLDLSVTALPDDILARIQDIARLPMRCCWLPRCGRADNLPPSIAGSQGSCRRRDSDRCALFRCESTRKISKRERDGQA